MTFLDNAKGEDAQKPTSQFSRGLIVSLRTDTHPKQAKILNHYGKKGNKPPFLPL